MKVTLNTVDAEENVPLDTMGKCPEADTISPNVRSALDPYLEDKIPSLYYIEILSDCNLKCPLCAFSHKEIFERKHGKMDFELFCKILDKIKLESPNATIYTDPH